MYRRLLVGTDGSDTANHAVVSAAMMARTHGAGLTVAHAFPPRLTGTQRATQAAAPPAMQWRFSAGGAAELTVQAAIDRARGAASDAPIEIIGRAEPGRPVGVLLRLIDELDPDALVVGNRDLAGIRIRSISRALSRRAPCDVIVVDTLGRRQRRRQTATNRTPSNSPLIASNS